MPNLTSSLILPRCPYCSIANPNLDLRNNLQTNNHLNNRSRRWGIYVCGGCGGVVIASAKDMNQEVLEYYPQASKVSQDIPERPRIFLSQALESMHAPSGAVLLAASAIDAMLKLKGLNEGTLNSRIEKAVSEHLITEDMGKWAHSVRLDANDQRHADESSNLPTESDAQRCLDFANALAELLFVLPSRVERGLKPGT